MDNIFKKGDRVYHHLYKWGIVSGTNIDSRPRRYSVEFDMGDELNVLQYELSFTEYTLNGFSQERPVNYDEWVGKWCKFWDGNINDFIIDRLNEVRNKICFIPRQYGSFKNCQLLTDEQVETLTK